ncbi:receptor-like protein 7 [Humulus lupulus]|uniref:receptor-like protein 7 n=1 Tax=Humulus lupulus TaxID=3486 RepID=UPI002B4107D0|nr:receptor-like protein 7 [Humulus lupulus]
MDFFSWFNPGILFFFLSVTSLSNSLSSISSPFPALPPPPLCHHYESFALLHFRNSFTFFNYTLSCKKYLGVSPNNTISWDMSRDCCTWSGVTCNEVTGHVIRLDLKCSGLQGILHSNNTLFSLAHLRSLILSYNEFYESKFSSQFGRFSNMIHLDLSYSDFTGQVPLELSYLSNLATLDLSGNYYLKLKTPSWKRIVANLTHLRELFLSGVNMSSTSPDSFMNFSTSLTSLDLSRSQFRGKLPKNVLSLPNLQQLDLSYNPNLNGSFLQYNWSSPIKVLNLSRVGVVIDLPHLCRKLKYLHTLSLNAYNYLKLSPSLFDNCTQITSLDLSNNNFGSYIPWPSILNLQLIDLDLSWNNLIGQLPEICSNSTKNSSLCVSSKHQVVGSLPLNLKSLKLYQNELNGTIPSWIYYLPSLQYIDLSSNKFSGSLQEFQHNSLVFLSLSFNNLQGFFPRSIFQQVNLSSLELFSINLSGVVQLDQFSKLKKLQTLYLSDNSLLLVSNNNNDTFPNTLSQLCLSSCGMREFPYSLRSLENLEFLDLSNNEIEGSVPKWLLNMGMNSLYFLNISHNLLTQIDRIPWRTLECIDIRSNQLQGQFPIPPPRVSSFSISNNKLVGGISPLICNLSRLELLDLSNNNLSGRIPPCLGNLRLVVLDLHMNKFQGTIPPSFAKGNPLSVLNLNENQLGGTLPKSLLNCKNLEFLDIGNNKIDGSFPQWLESLPKLQVLILRSNRFQGSIRNPKLKLPFPKLRILDLSGNEFVGLLPKIFFGKLLGMEDASSSYFNYMEVSVDYNTYQDSVTVAIKGFIFELAKIHNMFVIIDLSRNNFTGKIPKSIGKLKSLKSLNLSHNKLTGNFPPSLGNLINLEGLDVSSNKLTGKIPWQLASNLNQLGFLNLSMNQLEGQIPRSRQFDTFTEDSYNGNSGLCGFPISKSCNEDMAHQPSSSTSQQEGDEEHVNGFDWKIVLMGYGSGMVIGISVGYMVLKDNIIDGLVKKMKAKQWHLFRKRSKRNVRQNGGIGTRH